MYGASFGWARAFPMTKIGDTHETLSLLFKRDGAPPETILDRPKEQILNVGPAMNAKGLKVNGEVVP